jgi:hypothetical protein
LGRRKSLSFLSFWSSDLSHFRRADVRDVRHGVLDAMGVNRRAARASHQRAGFLRRHLFAGFLSTKIRGAGIAASIPAPIRASMRTARRRPSIRARADFEGAWQRFLSKRTEADFQEWRDERDWTARKYAMWETLRS